MTPFLEIVAGHPVRRRPAGESVLQRHEPCDALHVLGEGEVEVLRAGAGWPPRPAGLRRPSRGWLRTA